MKEIWKDIKDYEGLYQVSNFGNIRRIKFINNKVEKDKITILKPNKSIYLQIMLCKNGKTKRKYIHRLVAEAFIENPNNYPYVNHKDENKHNNNVNNLEWCTRVYNMNYGTVKERISESHKKENLKARKAVIQYSKGMDIIKIYNGICEAEKNTNINRCSIIRCCKNKQRTAGGFIWKYK